MATGILPVILNRQAGSLSCHSVLPYPPILFVMGSRLFRMAISIVFPEFGGKTSWRKMGSGYRPTGFEAW